MMNNERLHLLNEIARNVFRIRLINTELGSSIDLTTSEYQELRLQLEPYMFRTQHPVKATTLFGVKLNVIEDR